MKALAVIVLSLNILAFDISLAADFPTSPSQQLTPGQLCRRPDSHRYPENIPYCDRDVSLEKKLKVIQAYDQQLGYRISQMPRELFKIDHYIPLCMGGSNDSTNLWPQHASVYHLTDPLEALICMKMQNGRLLQKDAVRLIIQAKQNLSSVPSIISQLQRL